MKTTLHPSDEGLLRTILATVNDRMLKEAEPIVQAAIAEATAAMRRRLAAELIAQIDASVSYERVGRDLRVTIRRPDAG